LGAPTPLQYWSDLLLGRTVPAAVFGIFVVSKILLINESLAKLAAAGGRATATDYLYLADHVLGLAVFLLVAILYVVRLPRRGGDRRLHVTLVAFVASFALLGVGFLPSAPPSTGLVVTSVTLIVVGLAYTLWALLYLRRSFSILPEARRLVTTGPYALSRNPVDLGEYVAAVGIAATHQVLYAACLLAGLLAGQLLRIVWEERVLRRQFPAEFAEYEARVPRLLPQPWRRR
jgi:protein-S-isoprenylcysteine O-methyltransferase Ste14